MNRRKFIASTGATAVVLGRSQRSAAAASGRRALMKLGCQSAPTNESHLQYLARYGVRNICGYPQIGDGRLYATVDELKRLRELNAAYRQKFGFPFVMAIKGRTRGEIFQALEARMQHGTDEEFDRCLREIEKIARLRLGALLESN